MPRWAIVGLSCVSCGRVGFDGVRDGAGPPADVRAADALDPSLVMWFPFDGSFDNAVNGAAPMCFNGICPTLVPGKIGMAAQFDGVASCLILPDDGTTDTPALTLALWMNQPANGEYSLFAKLYMPATTVFDSWQVEDHSTQQYGFTTQNGGSKDTQLVVGPAPAAWHHIAMTYDGANKRIYVDGSLVATEAMTLPVQYDTSNVVLGCDFNSGMFIFPYAGLLDDVRFYNRALAQAEIVALAQ